MQTRHYAPSPDLAPWVRTLTWVEAPDGGLRRLVPVPALSLGFRLAGAAFLAEGGGWRRLPDVTIAGPHTRARLVRTEPGGRLLVARLHPALARAFHPDPGALLDATLPLTSTFTQEEATPRDEDAWLAAVEDFLRRRLRAGEPPDRLAVAAVDRIEAGQGQGRIAALARELGTSGDTLARRVKRSTGASPKQLAAVARLHAAFSAAQPDLTTRAMAAGYFDQPHFNAHVRRATGVAPSVLLRPGTAC